jgi:hypothetical protein
MTVIDDSGTATVVSGGRTQSGQFDHLLLSQKADETIMVEMDG